MSNSNVKIFDEIIGLVFNRVVVNDVCVAMFLEDDEDHFYLISHIQQCCEDVWLEEYHGELNDLEDRPITIAEMITEVDNESDCTWSFIKVGTSKGVVTLRFCGTSNGYYSEEVDIFKIKTPETRKREQEEYLKEQKDLAKQWEESLFN